MEPADTREATTYCLFPCRSRLLAVRIAAVEALMEAVRVVRLPLCPRPASALCAYRGGFLPIVRLTDDGEGWVAVPEDRRSAVLVLRTEHGPLGLLIDRGDIAVAENCRADREGDSSVREVEASPLPEGLVVAG